MDWPVDDHEEFARALASLSLSESSGQTWEELIDRLLNPGIPGEGMPPPSMTANSRRGFQDDILGVLQTLCGAKSTAPKPNR